MRKKFLNREDGAAYSMEYIMLFPFVLLILALMFFFSFMPYSRNMALDIVTRGADMVSVYGGNNGLYAPTAVIDAGGVDSYLKEKMKKDARAGFVSSGGKDDWTISCTPERARYVGEPVSCTVKYLYNPPLNPLGIADMLGLPIDAIHKTSTISKTAFSEVGDLR